MRVDTQKLQSFIIEEKLKMNHNDYNLDYYTGYISALSNVEGIIAQIEEEDDAMRMKNLKAHLMAMPDIPRDKKFWGKVYSSECVCGGTIYATRSTYNGHIRAKCDKCNWNIVE